MVAQGLGVSAVPSLCIQQMQELGARCIALAEPRVERRVGLLRLAGHELSSAAQALSDVLLHITDWNSLNLPRVGPVPEI
jgi:LysR family carnitine catabolism transcriptional activator